jgi:hypothetical protein
MDIGQVRDWVLIVTGIIWAILFLAILLVTLVIYYLLHKYLRIGRDFLHVRAREFLDQVEDKAEIVRQRTAMLPRYNAPVPPEVPERARRSLGFRLPFRRRRRWWQRVLPG